MELEQTQTQSAKLLATFFIGNSICAFDASGVQEVIRADTLTPVWHAPEEVVGVINLRGKIVTLLDLSMILGLGKSALGRETRVFVLEDREEFLGIVVDRVGDVIEVLAEEKHPLPFNVPASQARFFEEIYKSRGQVIAQLKPREILACARISN